MNFWKDAFFEIFSCQFIRFLIDIFVFHLLKSLIVAMMSMPVNAGNSWEDKTLIAKRFWSSFF